MSGKTWGDISAGPFRHRGVSSDGAKYLDGALDPAADVTMLSYDGDKFQLEPGYVYDQVLFAPRFMHAAEVAEIVGLGGPITDPLGIINAAARNVYAGTSLLDGGGMTTKDMAGNARVRVGNVSGLPWGSSGNTVPNDSFGLWADGQYVFISGYARVVAVIQNMQAQLAVPGTAAAGDIVSISDTVPLPFGTIYMPPGRRLVAFFHPRSTYDAYGANWSFPRFKAELNFGPNYIGEYSPATGGEITDFSAQVWASVTCQKSYVGLFQSGFIAFDMIVFDVDMNDIQPGGSIPV